MNNFKLIPDIEREFTHFVEQSQADERVKKECDAYEAFCKALNAENQKLATVVFEWAVDNGVGMDTTEIQDLAKDIEGIAKARGELGFSFGKQAQ